MKKHSNRRIWDGVQANVDTFNAYLRRVACIKRDAEQASDDARETMSGDSLEMMLDSIEDDARREIEQAAPVYIWIVEQRSGMEYADLLPEGYTMPEAAAEAADRLRRMPRHERRRVESFDVVQAPAWIDPDEIEPAADDIERSADALPADPATCGPDWDRVEEGIDVLRDLQTLEAAAAVMDDEIREAVHADLAPCAPAAFLAEYQRRHVAKYGRPLEW